MVFRRSLVRELTATAIGLFLVLLGILFTNLVLRLLARAAGGTVAPEGVLALLGFNALFYFNILLSVALFLTVLLTLSRWYRDSEMIVWFTSGQGLTAWLKPILWFASPFLLAIMVLSLWLSPWAEQRRLEYERQLESREELSLLAPGLFKEFRQAKLVMFIESINSFDGTIRNVFLHSIETDKDVTTVARKGHLEDAPNGDRFIVLEDGRRYEGQPGTAEFRTAEFERLGRRIEPAEVRSLPLSVKAMPLTVLVATDGAPQRAELFWRISVPISAFLLLLMAIPLAYVNPRMGRSYNLFAAALMYMVYSNCLNIVQSVIAQGRLSVVAGLLVIHSIAAMVVVLMFYRRLSVAGWIPSLPQRCVKTLNRYVGREVLYATLLIFVALLMLFAFFDLIHELGNVGKDGYTLALALLFVGLSLPGHVYELMPTAALIGTLFAIAQLVANSEYTVMRTSGASLTQITIAIVRVGIPLAIATFLAGEFFAPPAERLAQQVRLQGQATRIVAQQFQSGFWFKQDKTFANIRNLLEDMSLVGVRIYEFDDDLRLKTLRVAESGVFVGDGKWTLKNVNTTELGADGAKLTHSDEYSWASVLKPSILTVYQVAPEKLELTTLYDNIRVLGNNQQRTSRFEIALWNKIFYPAAVIVMMVLALPFAYFQRRAGGVGLRIFAGTILGLVFFLLGRLFSYLGVINDWPPLFSAAFPVAAFVAVAVGMLWWLERR